MEIRRLATAETYDLRSRILRPGAPLSEVKFPGDEGAVHFGLAEQGRLLSIVTLHPENSPRFADEGQWRLRGMATEDGQQGRGFGAEILRAALRWARQEGIRTVWCNARVKALSFYGRFGFTVESDLFEIPGAGPHHVMRVRL